MYLLSQALGDEEISIRTIALQALEQIDGLESQEKVAQYKKFQETREATLKLETGLRYEGSTKQILMELPIASETDPRRNTNPATSSYFDGDDRTSYHNLSGAAKKIAAFWSTRDPNEHHRDCRIDKNDFGSDLRLTIFKQYYDGSHGGFGFTVVRLGEDWFLFYGNEAW